MEPLPGGGLAFKFEGKSLDASHFVGDDKKKVANGAPPPEVDDELQNPLSLSAHVDGWRSARTGVFACDSRRVFRRA